MHDQGNQRGILEAENIIRLLLPLVDQAEQEFRSARGWGVVDILGGGLVTNLIKHARLNSAKDTMYRINDFLRDLQRELAGISIPTDYTMRMGNFATFADFVFDGVLADVYMQSKILSSLEQVRELRRRLEILRRELQELNERGASF